MKGSLPPAMRGQSAVPKLGSTPACFRGLPLRASLPNTTPARASWTPARASWNGLLAQVFLTMQIPNCIDIASRTPELSEAIVMRSMVVLRAHSSATHRETRTKSNPQEETDT
jgi:hypothetical protein